MVEGEIDIPLTKEEEKEKIEFLKSKNFSELATDIKLESNNKWLELIKLSKIN